jgi:hypothetical protein
MGFPEDLGRRALLQVKNESVAAAVEAVVALQAETVAKPEAPAPKEAEKKATLVPWNCEVCTYRHEPGAATCHICFSPAPASAFIDAGAEKAKEEAAAQSKRDEEEKLSRQRVEAEARERRAAEARREEELHQARVQAEFQKTLRVLERSRVVGTLFGSIKKALDRRPVFVGAVMANGEDGTTDVHVRCLEYRDAYLASFIGAPTRSGTVTSRLTGERFESEAACIDALLANNRVLLESVYPALGDSNGASRSSNWVLASADVGVVRLPLSAVTLLVQLGSDASPGEPLHTLLVGKKADASTAAYLVTLEPAAPTEDPADRTTLRLSATELEDGVFPGAAFAEILDVRLCPETQQLVVQTAEGITAYSFAASAGSLATERRGRLVAGGSGQRIASVRHGRALVSEAGAVKTYRLDAVAAAGASSVPLPANDLGARPGAAAEASHASSPLSPDSVTIDDIKRYEALMKGKAVGAVSNAQAPRGRAGRDECGRPYFKRHTWIAGGEEEFGPMQVRFESAANLISLDIDLTFSCGPAGEPSVGLEAPSEVVGQSSLATEGQPAEQETEGGAPAQDDTLRSLGHFTIKGVDALGQAEDAGSPGRGQKTSQGSGPATEEAASFLPLIVHKHKGAQFNSSHQVNTIVLDNSQVFASNYARPEFYFRHLHGEAMTIDKFTIRSQLASRCGAYPVGRGLLFMADSLESFELTKPFHRFTAEDYGQWKQARMQDARPLRPCEPVAFFEFDEQPSLTVDIDFKRPCRYIMLKPTGFRSKPHHFRQSVNDLPMELEFFGAQGSSQPLDPAAEFCDSEDRSLAGRQGEPGLLSGHTIVIHDLDSGEELLRLEGVKIS